MKISFDLSRLNDVVNKKYYPFIVNQDRMLNFYGSAGSGKSHFVAQKILVRIMRAMAVGQKHRFLCLRKTQPACRKSIVPLFQYYIDQWGLNKIVHFNKTEAIFNFIDGQQIICSGLDDETKIKSIEGVTGAWLEEVTEFTKQDYLQVNLRVRGNNRLYKQIITSFNPVSKAHWIYQDYFAKGKGSFVHSTYKDNRFIDPDYAEILAALEEEDYDYFKVYALGEWGELRGLIYSNWDLIDEFPENVDDELYSIDFGFNNPSSIVRIGVKDSVDCYVEEKVYRTKMTTGDIIAELEEIIPGKDKTIKADSAEPDRIEEIKRAGFHVIPARKGKNSVRNGIDTVKRKRLHITKDSVNTISEIQAYKWKVDKDGNPLDEPVKFKDHSMDAIRYGIGDMEAEETLIWEL